MNRREASSRRLLGPALLAALLTAAAALAAPAIPQPYQLTQPDGSSFLARAWGDEWAHGFETLDGFAIGRDPSGYWVYLQPGKPLARGKRATAPLVVGRDRPEGLPLGLERAAAAGPPGDAAHTEDLPPGDADFTPPVAGSHRLLVLVADFTPSVSQGVTEAQLSDRYFGLASPPADPSVRQYWQQVSYDRLDLLPAAESYGTANDGIVLTTLAYPDPECLDKPVAERNECRRKITRDALLAADPFVDFASFDGNNDGYLNSNELHLMVVVRGLEGASADPACHDQSTTWAHRWVLGGDNPPVLLDGKVVGDPRGARIAGGFSGGYMQEGEWHGCPGPDGHPATIGVAAHELGHDLGNGLPDLYNTRGCGDTCTGTQGFGIGDWGLQGSGLWNRVSGRERGSSPSFPDPWSRWVLGFLTPQELNVSVLTAQTFTPIETETASHHGVYLLRPSTQTAAIQHYRGRFGLGGCGKGQGEYFLLENRARLGFDQGLPGEGLLVWHVNEAINDAVTASCTPNDERGIGVPGGSRLLALEQADGSFDLECFGCTRAGHACNSGDDSDPWPGGSSNPAFAKFSTPSSLLYNLSSQVCVRDIVTAGADVQANVRRLDCAGFSPPPASSTCTGPEFACSAPGPPPQPPGTPNEPLNPAFHYRTHQAAIASSILADARQVYEFRVQPGRSYRFSFCEGPGTATPATIGLRLLEDTAGTCTQRAQGVLCNGRRQIDYTVPLGGPDRLYLEVGLSRGVGPNGPIATQGVYTLAYRELPSCRDCASPDSVLTPDDSLRTQPDQAAAGCWKLYRIQVQSDKGYVFSLEAADGGAGASEAEIELWGTSCEGTAPLQRGTRIDYCSPASAPQDIFLRVKRRQGAATGSFTLAHRGFSCKTCPQFDVALPAATTSFQTVAGGVEADCGRIHRLNALAGQTYRFSLCPADGGAASFDSLLEARAGATCAGAGSNDDACGTASRLDVTPAVSGPIYVTARGKECGPGTYTLAYRSLCAATACPAFDRGPFSPQIGVQTDAGTLGGDCGNVYRFDLVAGASYRFSLCAGDGGAAAFDSLLQLEASGCVLRATSDDTPGCGTGSRIDYTAAVTAPAFLRLRNKDAATAAYTLAWNQLPPSATCANPDFDITPSVAKQVDRPRAVPAGPGVGVTYSVHVTAGKSYRFSLCPGDGGSTTFAAQLFPYDNDCIAAPAERSADCAGGWVIDQTAVATGVVYLEVRNLGATTGTFRLSHCELSPATWTARAPIPTPRHHPMVAEVNGKIYVIGGGDGGGATDVNEMYDPATNTWAARAPMFLRRWLTAAAVVNGRIYVIGGTISGQPLGITESYDPVADSWAGHPSMPTARIFAAAAAVNGKIYVLGGYDGLNPLATNEEFDPGSDQWATRAPLPQPSFNLAAAALAGKVYAVGGSPGSNQRNDEYDPVADGWTARNGPALPRSESAAAVASGRIYVLGGSSSDTGNEEYDPATDSWKQLAPMPTGRSALGAAVADGKIYAMGGSVFAANEEFSPPVCGDGGATCGLGPDPCTSACRGGCGVPAGVQHSSVLPCGGGGSINLAGTQFENTCGTGSGGCTIAEPPLRFWRWDDYAGANSGCGQGLGLPWMVNPWLDFGIPPATSAHWVLYQANWLDPQVDGCGLPFPTVAEVSFPDAAAEGTVGHRSWYAIESASLTGGIYNFDEVQGEFLPQACSPRDIVVRPVDGLHVFNRADSCTGTGWVSAGTPNAIDPSWLDISILLHDPFPAYFTENGFMDPTRELILGYEVMYTTASEPTSSRAAGWLPARYHLDPTQARAALSDDVYLRVAVPNGPPVWLATRLVYLDASLGQDVRSPYPANEAGPLLVSPLSHHCGPVGPTPGGACCTTGGCRDLSQADCTAAGGVYQGNGTTCRSAPGCSVVPCCRGGQCLLIDAAGCVASGGVVSGCVTGGGC